MKLQKAFLLALLLSSPMVFGDSEAKLPTAKDFHKCVLYVIKKYPTDGTHQYYWPKGSKGGWAGTTCDLKYLGKVICKGDIKKRCYCCGITYEVFFKAWEIYCQKKKIPFRILELTPRDLIKLRSHWFVASGDNTGCQGGITKYKLGKAVKKFHLAQKGDFAQIWRKNGSGHSVIFMGWIYQGRKIVGLKYWSTQKSTKGIGYRTEYIHGKKGIVLEKVYIGRVGR